MTLAKAQPHASDVHASAFNFIEPPTASSEAGRAADEWLLMPSWC
jgi:hypothetical protein